MSPRLARSFRAEAALLLALFNACFLLQAWAVGFQTLALSGSGSLGEGVAVFYPQGVEPSAPSPSLALLASPVAKHALPPGWVLVPQFSSDGSSVRAQFSLDASIDLYGGGEVTGPLRRNGTSITLWNTDNYMYTKDSGRRLYQSHPWILGLRADGSAFGLLFDSTWKATLDCTTGVSFTSQGPAFPVIVIDKPSPQAVLGALAELTGHIPLPPRWALGYHQCRYSYYPDARVREIADTFRQRQIPCDVIWLDIDYMDGFRVFTFDKSLFPDPKGLNDYLHASGFKSIWMIDPGVKHDTGYSVYKTGTAVDAWVKTAAGADYQGSVWPGACVFPDFTRPETRSWWSALYPPFMANGVDGIWNDMNEPAVFNTSDWTMPEDNWHRGGEGLPPGPHLQYHNVYGMLMVQASREGILASAPEKRPFVLTRANFLGGQRYAATWTGDNSSTDHYLQLSIPMSLTLGLSGQPFNGPDIGGFDGNATGELWAKWIGLGAFYPFSRAHSSKGTNNKEPWAFGTAVEQTARIALGRRYRLLPYLYTLFRQASLDGLPVMRPVFMAEPTNAALRSEQQAFTLGADLLVVPRWAASPRLPGGSWRELSLVEGDTADSNQPRVLLRAGAILPLGRIVQNTTEDSLSTLSLAVALDADGKADGLLYEDAGNGFGYQTGDYTLTALHAEKRGGIVRVTATRADGARESGAGTVALQAFDVDGTLLPETLVALEPPALAEGAADAAWLSNLSMRAQLAAGSGSMTAGFVISGTTPKTVLVRAGGPSLSRFGITQPVEDPVLELHQGPTVKLASNDDWSSGGDAGAALAKAFASVGAYDWSVGSKDAALLVTLAPGAYTAVFTDKSRKGGAGIIEVYDLAPGSKDSRLSNLSGLSFSGQGEQVQVVGFAVSGSAARRVLVRAAGPSLDAFGVSGALREPSLALYQSTHLSAFRFGWDAGLEDVFDALGAFAWKAASGDAAQLVSLAPGEYTVVVGGKGGTTGVVLLEVYDAPGKEPLD